jgi:predicted PolB exonuclease-like 3'-5' exonuclease
MTLNPATLVTWNGRTFDLPVLSARALHLGVPWGWYYDERNIRYRYSSDGHDDLMDFLSDFGAARPMKLGDVARLIGLPGKTDMDGSKVEGIAAEGKSSANEGKIAAYCLQDAVQTALVFLRTRYHLEIVDAAGYAASVDTFAKDPVVRELLDVDWKKFRVI